MGRKRDPFQEFVERVFPNVGFPQPRRGRWARNIFRAALHVFRHQSGVAVTVAGTVAALGAAFVALGIYQSDRAHESAFDSGWVGLGLVLMVAAALVSLAVVAALVFGRIGDQAKRYDLVGRLIFGQTLRARLDEKIPVPTADIDEWNELTVVLLGQIDKTLGLRARYNSPLGLPITSAFTAQTKQWEYDLFLQVRLQRLAEFIAELER